MRIDIVTGPFMELPPNSIGAVEKKWSLVAQAWRGRGREICFFSVAKNLKDPGLDSRNIYVKKYRQTRFGVLNRLKDLHYAVRVASRLKGGDVLIINDFTLPFLAPFFRRKYKLVVSSVERTPFVPIHRYQRGIDLFVGVSAAVVDAMKGYMPQSRWQDIKCVHNPVDTQRLAALSLASSEDSICYCGRIHPEKGLHFLARALRILNDEYGTALTLRLVGPWETERNGGGQAYLESLQSELGPRLIHEGTFTDPQEMACAISKSRYFCYPSVARGESFGVAPVEAMALGRIVILSDLACFRDFAQDHENALVFSLDGDVVQNILGVIRKAVTRLDLHESLSASAIRTAKEFTVDKIADSFLHTLEMGIKRKTGSE